MMSTEGLQDQKRSEVAEADAHTVPPGYKHTEAGIIPDEWEVRRLRQVVEFLDGQRRPVKSGDRAKMTGIYPYYGASGIVDYVNDYLFDEDLILLGEDGENILSRNTRLAFRVSGKVWVNNHAHVLRPNGKVGIAYLVEYLESLDYQQYNSGTAQPKLNKQTCLGIPVLVPPPAEQVAVAEALSDVDELLAALDALIDKKRALKQGTMQQLLNGKTRLPEFSLEWETQPVGDLEKERLVKLSRGKVISKKDIEAMPGAFPIYSSSIHNDGLFGRYGEFMFDEELITWSVDGGGDFFHRPKHKFSVTNVCGFMHVDTSRINYRFLAMQLQLLHTRKSFDYQSKAHPSVVRKEYEVQLPSLAEQTAIAEVLSVMDAEIESLGARRNKTRAIKQGMMQQLLTGRVRLVRPQPPEAYA